MADKMKRGIKYVVLAVCSAVCVLGVVVYASNQASKANDKTEDIDLSKYVQEKDVEEEVLGVDYGDKKADIKEDLFFIYEGVELDAQLQSEIEEICRNYDISEALIFSLIEHESRYKADAVAKNGVNVGLCQVSTKWFKNRAKELGIDDFFEPHNNVTLACDYLHELFERMDEPYWVLMVYAMGEAKANELWDKGYVTSYVKDIVRRAQELEEQKK